MGLCVRAPILYACLLVCGCSSSSSGPVQGQEGNDAAADGKLTRDAGLGVDSARVDARHARDAARVDAGDAGPPTDSGRVDARRRRDGARADAHRAKDGATVDVRDAGVDAPHSKDAASDDARDGAPDDARDAAPPPVFTLEAGTTWTSLYRDYFGPAGVATCVGAAAGDCHASPSDLGYQMSYFLCPAGDAGAACYTSFTSPYANLLDPDASFVEDPVSDVLCQPGPIGTMPLNCTYVFTSVDIERIADWVNAGAPDN